MFLYEDDSIHPLNRYEQGNCPKRNHFPPIIRFVAFMLLSEASADLINGLPCSQTVFGGTATCRGSGICDVGDEREGTIALSASASHKCTNIFYKNKIKVDAQVGAAGL